MAEISKIIEAKIDKYIKENKSCSINWDKATMREVMKASRAVARKYSSLINESFDFDSIDEQLPQLKTVLQNLRLRSAKTTSAFIAIQNERSNINIQSQIPSEKSDSIDNLISRISDGTIINDGAIDDKDLFLVNDQVVEHIATEGCMDTLEENAELAAEAGVKTLFTRHLGDDGCCSWCQTMAGSYTHDQLPEYFWATHDNCDCWIEYKTERVHDKISYSRDAKGIKRKNTEHL